MLRKKAGGILLSAAVLAMLIHPVNVQAGGGFLPVAACGVPIPESAPGEETKDLVSALIGLSALTAVVTGGLLFLQYKKPEKE